MEYERFSSLVVPHTAALARVAAALVGLADAEDAAQEALLRAWQHWTSLRDEAAVRAWLLRITVNVCRNWQAGHFGTTRRLNAPLDRELHDTAPDQHGGEPQNAEALDVRHAVATLPEDLRRVVALRFYAGMNSTEIGEALEMPAATVRTHLRRALELLRERLAHGDSRMTSKATCREGASNGQSTS
jgi:RNA polymerase sigma-70 factor (ECF subfamily)